MSKKKKKSKKTMRNFVAKFAAEFTRSEVFRDKTKYTRKKKHKSIDSI